MKDAKVQPVLNIDDFPEYVHPVLRELDDEGDGVIQMDELTEALSSYAIMKRAAMSGHIALSTLPKEIQPLLQVFDVDKDGTVAPLELARAAELYKQSKQQVKKLTKLVVLLLLVIGAFLAAITGLIFMVVEASKETTTDTSGLTKVKGTDTVAATNTAISKFALTDAFSMNKNNLDTITSLYFSSDGVERSYTITGWTREKDPTGGPALVTFFSARGDTVQVDWDGVRVYDSNGNLMYEESEEDEGNENESGNQRRHLLRRGGSGASEILGIGMSGGGDGGGYTQIMPYNLWALGWGATHGGYSIQLEFLPCRRRSCVPPVYPQPIDEAFCLHNIGRSKCCDLPKIAPEAFPCGWFPGCSYSPCNGPCPCPTCNGLIWDSLPGATWLAGSPAEARIAPSGTSCAGWAGGTDPRKTAQCGYKHYMRTYCPSSTSGCLEHTTCKVQGPGGPADFTVIQGTQFVYG